MQNSEAVKGVALPGTFQLKIDNEWTSVINFQNDSSNQVFIIYLKFNVLL